MCLCLCMCMCASLCALYVLFVCYCCQLPLLLPAAAAAVWGAPRCPLHLIVFIVSCGGAAAAITSPSLKRWHCSRSWSPRRSCSRTAKWTLCSRVQFSSASRVRCRARGACAAAAAACRALLTASAETAAARRRDTHSRRRIRQRAVRRASVLQRRQRPRSLDAVRYRGL